MVPPAPKRRKRNVVHPSDDEDYNPQPPRNTLANYLVPSPDKQQNRRGDSTADAPAASSPPPSPVTRKTACSATAKGLQSRAHVAAKSGRSSASGSPPKPRSRPATRSKPEEKQKTADLKTLFSRQAERAPNPPPTVLLDDIISDPISDDDILSEKQAATSSRIVTNARKRFRDGTPTATTQGAALPIAASQRFLRPPRPVQDAIPPSDQRPWAERFGPVNLGELAVHKRKVADVRGWLEDVMAGRLRQRLLILKGSAGTGKTTTMRLLARDMRCEILEWKNPTTTGLGFTSASTQFEDFLGRGSKFGQLDVDSDVSLGSRSPVGGGNSDTGRKIILIEEFPNTFNKSSSALLSFRNTLLQYLAASTPSLAAFGQQPAEEPVTPVVLVISETQLTTTSALADSFTVHRLLGSDITRHAGTAVIEFNAIAPTFLTAALELIVQKEARQSGRRRTPGPVVLQRLGEIGDIRSAVSALEFLCLKGDADADWGSKVVFTKSKRGAKDGTALTKDEQDSLELISQREASLNIFHAVGKVMYNKRDEAPMSDQTLEGQAEIMPSFLARHSRPRRSEVSVDALVDETGADTHTYISALHENYALSCAPTGPADPFSAMDYVNESIEYLSESDLLCPTSDIFFGGRGFGGGCFAGRDSASHVLRQEEIAFQVASRGLLFSFPQPVKRIKTAPGRPGKDTFKMYYPTSMKLWKEKEELEGVVDYWSTKLLKEGEISHNVTDGAAAFRKPKATTSKDGASRSTGHGRSGQNDNSGPVQPAAPLLFLGSSARRELLLERLPYMAHIARRRRDWSSDVQLRDLEKAVSFSGLIGTTDEEAADTYDSMVGSSETWATDKPTEESSPRQKRVGIREKGDNSVATLAVQKLVLSDDDIEDDD